MNITQNISCAITGKNQVDICFMADHPAGKHFPENGIIRDKLRPRKNGNFQRHQRRRKAYILILFCEGGI
jgi:hypothetical protein